MQQGRATDLLQATPTEDVRVRVIPWAARIGVDLILAQTLFFKFTYASCCRDDTRFGARATPKHAEPTKAR